MADSPTILKNLEGTEAAPDRGRALERNNLILVLLGSLGSFYFRDWAVTWSFFAGGALTVINLHLLRRIVISLVGTKQVSRGKLVAQVLAKFLGGLGALAVIMLVFHPRPIAFLLGLSTIVLAIFFEGLLGIFRSE